MTFTRQHQSLAAAPCGRRGSALVLVLTVIAMLSLGAYTFSELMLAEFHATDTYARQVQARAAAQSGVEYVAALLTPDGGGFGANLYDNPDLFHIALRDGSGFSVVAPREDAANVGSGQVAATAVVRMGLMDECAKININALANPDAFDPDEPYARNLLLTLPGMTSDVADAILDWVDGDSDQREYGAESTSYSGVLPRNGSLDTLEELLLVRGVTPELLYGEDANRNGVLDPNENDGGLSQPADNGDGVLDLGWAAFLTVNSKENNLRHSADRFGEKRLNVNEALLAELYDQLEEEFDEDVAKFVVAYRLNGPVADDTTGVSSVTATSPLTGRGQSSSTGNAITDAAIQETTTNIAKNAFSGEGNVTRGGMDLTRGSSTTIGSLFDLIGAQAQAEVDGQTTTFDSPWSAAPGDLQRSLPEMFDALTVTANPTIVGRINVNQARREVLQGIPNMPEGTADAIVAARASRPSGSSSESDPFATSGWLLIHGVVDLPTMRLLEPFITAQGEVFRMQVVGHSDRGGPVSRIEAILDATQAAPAVLMQRDLAELGTGFRRNDLPAFSVP